MKQEKSITFPEQQFDCTQREIVVDIAQRIYEIRGVNIRDMDLMYLFNSEDQQEKSILTAAEDIFGMFLRTAQLMTMII